MSDQERKPLFETPRTPVRRVAVMALCVSAAVFLLYACVPLSLAVFWGPEGADTVRVLLTRSAICASIAAMSLVVAIFLSR